MTRLINAMSIDLEHWWSNEFLLKYLPENPQHQVIEATDGLLRLLKKHDTKATFFVLGSVAEKYPDYIKSIYEEGHDKLALPILIRRLISCAKADSRMS